MYFFKVAASIIKDDISFCFNKTISSLSFPSSFLHFTTVKDKIPKNSILARNFNLRQGNKDKSCPGQEIRETRTRKHSCNHREIYVSRRVSVRLSGAGLKNVHSLEYTFVLDIHCQQLGKMCQLEGVCALLGRRDRECTISRICIRHTLPTIGECWSVGGCLTTVLFTPCYSTKPLHCAISTVLKAAFPF